MVDQPESVAMEEQFLWPSPEMRQRAIDEAVKSCGDVIAKRVQKEIEDKLKVSTDSWVKEITAKAEELQKLVEDGKQVLLSLQKIKQDDFSKITEDLSVRLAEVEVIFAKNDFANSLPGFSNEHDAKVALKGICELLYEIVNVVRSDPQYNTVAYNLSDYDLKGRVLGSMIVQAATKLFGHRFEKMEYIASTGQRL